MYLKHIWMLAALWLAGAVCFAQAAPLNAHPALQMRVEKLENFRQSEELVLKSNFEALKGELNLQFKELKADVAAERNENHTNLLYVVVLGLVGLLGGWFTVYKLVLNGIRTKMEQALSEKVQGNLREVQQKLDAARTEMLSQVEDGKVVTQNLIRAGFEFERENFLGVVARFGMEQSMRNSKRILVLVETADRIPDKLQLFQQVFLFPQVTVQVMDHSIPVQEYDLVVFDHEEGKDFRKGDFKKLDSKEINQFIRQHEEEGPTFIFFGTQNDRMEVRADLLSYANSRFTLFARIMEVFVYREALRKSEIAGA